MPVVKPHWCLCAKSRPDTNLLDGSQVSVPMMKQNERLHYTEGEGYQAVELPYKGGAIQERVH